MRRKLVLVLSLFGLLAVAGGGYVAWETARPHRGWRKAVFVQLPPGASTRAIAARLRDAGVLRRQWPFLLLHYVRPRLTLKAGEYYFDQPVSPRDVIWKLRRGDVYLHAVTVPEGLTLFETAQALASTGLATAEEVQQAFLDPAPIAGIAPGAVNLEGYLFPDTYHFSRPVTARQITAAMVKRFRSVYEELGRRHQPVRAVAETVTMASLVEKETGVAAERPLVASVFYNRLAIGMPLQCDPTVVYAAILAGRYRGTIYRSDLAFDSPYNTYKHPGLPPGPIANPGRASLEAAMAPATTSYLFFVSDGNGTHRFSTTMAEHDRAVAEYRRSTAARPRTRQ